MAISTTTIKTAIGAAGIAAAGLMTASPALADPTIANVGAVEQVSGIDYTVKDLRPSGNNDGIWYADVTAKAVTAGEVPNIGEFNARSADGTNYTAVLGTNPDGLPAGPIPAGAVRNGRIYFNVGAGQAPNSVVYTPGGNNANAVIWKVPG
jgi:hypothetical protein